MKSRGDFCILAPMSIRDIVRESYRDAGLNRWVARNKSVHRTILYCLFTGAIAGALLESPEMVLLCGGSFVLWLWILALEHIYIGHKIEKIMDKLREAGYNVSWEEAWSQAGIE